MNTPVWFYRKLYKHILYPFCWMSLGIVRKQAWTANDVLTFSSHLEIWSYQLHHNRTLEDQVKPHVRSFRIRIMYNYCPPKYLMNELNLDVVVADSCSQHVCVKTSEQYQMKLSFTCPHSKILIFVLVLCWISADPPGDQTGHQESDHPRAAGAARVQLPIHSGLLWCLLQRRGNQHLHGAYGMFTFRLVVFSKLHSGLVFLTQQWAAYCPLSCPLLLVLAFTFAHRMEGLWTSRWRKQGRSQSRFLEKSALLWVIPLLI